MDHRRRIEEALRGETEEGKEPDSVVDPRTGETVYSTEEGKPRYYKLLAEESLREAIASPTGAEDREEHLELARELLRLSVAVGKGSQ